MAGISHKSVGAAYSQAEYEATDSHDLSDIESLYVKPSTDVVVAIGSYDDGGGAYTYQGIVMIETGDGHSHRPYIMWKDKQGDYQTMIVTHEYHEDGRYDTHKSEYGINYPRTTWKKKWDIQYGMESCFIVYGGHPIMIGTTGESALYLHRIRFLSGAQIIPPPPCPWEFLGTITGTFTDNESLRDNNGIGANYATFRKAENGYLWADSLTAFSGWVSPIKGVTSGATLAFTLQPFIYYECTAAAGAALAFNCDQKGVTADGEYVTCVATGVRAKLHYQSADPDHRFIWVYGFEGGIFANGDTVVGEVSAESMVINAIPTAYTAHPTQVDAYGGGGLLAAANGASLQIFTPDAALNKDNWLERVRVTGRVDVGALLMLNATKLIQAALSFPLVTVSTITTAAAVNLTAVQLMGGLILRDCNGASRADVLPDIADVIAAFGTAQYAPGTSFEFVVQNTSDAAETITLSDPGTAGTWNFYPASLTIAQGVAKRFIAVIVSGTEISLYSEGGGTY